MGYQRPCSDPISCSYKCHKDRNPPSPEPGTDYACAYGSDVYAAEDGIVFEVRTSSTGGTGRYLTIDLDDGRRVRYLHLSYIVVSKNQRVKRGQLVSYSGASGYGQDWYYGPHVHTTLFPKQNYDFSSTIDFEKYVGPDSSPQPPKEEELIMGMMYCITDNDKRPDDGGKRVKWALAGTGNGKAAWFETSSETRAGDWRETGQYGTSTWLSKEQWNNTRLAYRPDLAATLSSTDGLNLILLGLVVLAMVGLSLVLIVTA